MSSLSSLHAFPDSSSAHSAPTLSPSSVAVAARDSRSALIILQECSTSQAPSSFQSRSTRSRWYSPHQSDQSGRPSSRSLHKVGPFDIIDKHLGARGREAQIMFFILGFLLIVTTHGHEGLVPCLVDVRSFEIAQQADTRRLQLERRQASLRRMARTSGGPH